MNRRDFLRSSLSAVGSSSLFASRLLGFEPVSVANPLGVYPNRGWEEVYRDQYKVSIPLTLDASGQLFHEFDVRSVPTLLLIDSSGHIVRRVSGAAAGSAQGLNALLAGVG